jgi:hypothetical protein
LNGATGKSTTTLLSYLARLSYNYKEKYFLTASYRRDASSRFGPLNRWGNFLQYLQAGRFQASHFLQKNLVLKQV